MCTTHRVAPQAAGCLHCCLREGQIRPPDPVASYVSRHHPAEPAGLPVYEEDFQAVWL